ncbi:MAG: hypothetical protein ACTILN_13455 [Marinobacter sp.]
MNPAHTHYQPYYRQFAAVLGLVLVVASFSAHAEKLTDNTIRAFITTLEKAQTLEPEFEELNNDDDSKMPDFSRIFSSSVEELKGEEAYGRMENLVQKNGFENLTQWAATGDRIYGAWMAIEMADQSPEINQEMQRAMAELDNNPNMSAEQKAQMRSLMEAGLGVTKVASEAPPADIEAVKPHMNALRAVTQGKED